MKFLIKDSIVFFMVVSVTEVAKKGKEEEGQNAVVRQEIDEIRLARRN